MTARATSSITSQGSPGFPGSPVSPPPPPARFAAYDRQTWKEIAYLLANLPIGVAGFVYVVVTLAAGGGLAVTVVGLPL
ncbi:MAG: sensor histidine kinase, partial [Streptomyces sp.]